ncbi:MAG: xanthine dehydrogenase family protein subunit M [Chloroflexota bacterium]|nr:xanthine dehydrogenase family protein subunit M [Chloroflexota bacterium]
MRPFELVQADSLAHALSLLRQYGGEDVHLMAGGTSLVLLMNLGLVEPTHVVLLRRVPELHGIHSTGDGGLEIRALTTHRQAELSPVVNAYCPALAATFGHVATVRIRNQGTIGGNLAHADPAQDPPPMLIALGAEIVVASDSGERRLPLEEFFLGYLTTTLQAAEIVTAVRLPPLTPGMRAVYHKFLPRTQDDYATVSVAAALCLDADGRCGEVRVVLGGAAPVPLRVRAVEDALRGEVPTPERIREASELTLEAVDPPDDVRGSASYKRQMARVWTERALASLSV